MQIWPQDLGKDKKLIHMLNPTGESGPSTPQLYWNCPGGPSGSSIKVCPQQGDSTIPRVLSSRHWTWGSLELSVGFPNCRLQGRFLPFLLAGTVVAEQQAKISRKSGQSQCWILG